MDTITAKAQTLIRKPSGIVFDALVDSKSMSKYWFTRRDDGLIEGKSLSWFVGVSKDAPAIEVRVIEVNRPEKIHIEWGEEGHYRAVVWELDEVENGVTKLSIEESGFEGSNSEIVRQALDSTGGFNQMIIALKALVEHDTTINVVADHA